MANAPFREPAEGWELSLYTRNLAMCWQFWQPNALEWGLRGEMICVVDVGWDYFVDHAVLVCHCLRQCDQQYAFHIVGLLSADMGCDKPLCWYPSNLE
jgi:hypothetical protein